MTAPHTLLTVDEAAEETGLKVRTVRQLFNQRALPLVKINHRLYVRRADLLAFIEASTIAPKGDTREAGK